MPTNNLKQECEAEAMTINKFFGISYGDEKLEKCDYSDIDVIVFDEIIVLRKTAVKLPWLMRAEALWNIGRATSTLKLSFILVFETLVGFYDFYLCHMPIPPKMGRFRYKDRGYDSTIDGGVPVG